MGKILLIVSFVITLLSAGLGIINRGKLAEANDKATSSEAAITQTKSQLTAKETALKTATENLATVTAEKEQLASQISSLQSEADKVKAQATEFTTQETALKAEITKLTADVQSKTQEIEQLKANTPAAPTGPDPETQAKLQEQETLITKLQGDLDSSRSKLDLLEKEKQDRVQMKMRDGLEGRILAVNPAWNFVVLNLGDKNGVMNNAELLVKRGTQLVGKIRVTSVEPSTSIADIVANSVPQGTTIAPGDNVIYQSIEE